MAPQHPDEPDTPSYDPGQEPESAVQDGGEERAAERSAERAAAFAATEGFHPLRLRPYVAEAGGEPGADSGESTVRHLVHGGGEGPATADLGLFPEVYSGLEYPTPGEDLEDPDGFEGFAGLDGDGEGLDGAGGLVGAEAAAYAAARRGRHRRRRRRIVVAAATVAASALAAGAVAVTGQVMSDEQGATGQALPDLTSSSVPDVTLPADAAPATAKGAAPVTQERARAKAPAPSTSAPASPAPTATTTAPPSGTPGTPTPGGTGTPSAPPVPTAPPAQPAGTPSAQVLQLGDSGAAVEDLQRRLTEVWVYHGPVDGVFDKQVQRAVETFQLWYMVSDAPDGSHDGVYGPNTRAALERQTSGR